MANYPSSTSSFTTKLAGDTVQAAHINDLQSEVTAIEAGLLSGFEHHAWPNTSDTYDLGKTATRWRALYLSGLIDSSKVGAHLISGAGSGAQTLLLRNSTAGTANYSALLLTTDVSPEALLRAHSSTFTTAAPYAASGVTLESQGSGGLSLAATHASGTISFYTGSTTLGGAMSATIFRKYGTAGEARLQVDNTTNYAECHVRAASGKKAYFSLTEDSVADRWALGVENGDSALYLRQGAPSSSTVAMKVTSAGSVSTPLQPRVLAYHSVNQSYASGGALASVNFDTEVYDVGGLHDTSSNNQRFIVVEDGIYQFGAVITWAGQTGGTRTASIYKNGATSVAYSDLPSPNSDAISQVIASPPLSLVATDYLTLAVSQNSGSSVNVVGGATFTQAWMIRVA